MNASTARVVFALLCALGTLAIVLGMWLEARRMRRGESVVSPRHFRWRLMGGALWCLTLLTYAYASLFQWPQNKADVLTGKRFIALISGATSLMMVAFGLLIIDVLQTGRERRALQRKFDQDVNDLARRELEKARAADEKSSEKTP